MRALLLVALIGCGGSSPPVESDAREGVLCSTTEVGVRFYLPIGYEIRPARNGCRVVGAHENVQLLVMAVGRGDAGPEQVLNEEPDGARRWVHATAVLGAEASDQGERRLTVAGVRTTGYRFLGTPPFSGGERDVTVARIAHGDHNLVVVVSQGFGEEEQFIEAREILRTMQLE